VIYLRTLAFYWYRLDSITVKKVIYLRTLAFFYFYRLDSITVKFDIFKKTQDCVFTCEDLVNI
jgi:hypothetical protein